MKKNTVFVIGAGTGKEVNLPTGYELKGKISQLLDIRFDFDRQISGDRIIVNALREYVRDKDGRAGDINPYLQEAWHIRKALPQAISIDNFIDAHKDNDKIALCGKLAIVRSILQSEGASLIYFERQRRDSNIDYNSLEKSWYLPFFQLLTENCCKNDLKERFGYITLIIFNYDRSIEHFIYYGLQNYYGLSEAEAASIVKCINIYHPYGCVGALPWQDSNGSIEFGADPDSRQLLQFAEKIKTFAEGTDPNSSEILSIRRHMSTAERLVFMGFAFHKLNMQLIKPDSGKNISALPDCYATTYGISHSDDEVICAQIDELYSSKINTNTAKVCCGDFFHEFWRSLAF